MQRIDLSNKCGLIRTGLLSCVEGVTVWWTWLLRKDLRATWTLFVNKHQHLLFSSFWSPAILVASADVLPTAEALECNENSGYHLTTSNCKLFMVLYRRKVATLINRTQPMNYKSFASKTANFPSAASEYRLHRADLSATSLLIEA